MGAHVRTFGVVLALVGTLWSAAQAKAEERPAPDGYRWHAFSIFPGQLLVPDGWFVKEAKTDYAREAFISKESIDEQEKFVTGVTAIVIRIGAPSSPSVYAKDLVANARQQFPDTFVGTQPEPVSGFEESGFAYRSTTPEGRETTVMHRLLANDATGALYMFICEGPSNEFAQSITIMEPIIQMVGLNTAY